MQKVDECRRRCDVLRKTSRPERQRLGNLGRRRLTVGYGGLTELEMKLTEDADWTQFRLNDEVRRNCKHYLSSKWNLL